MTRNIKEFVNHGVMVGAAVRKNGEIGADHVCILLGLYNGASTLGVQLDSIASQTHLDWSLIISDDGSQDNWIEIVSRFRDRHDPVRTWITQGPRRGFARNFLALAEMAGPLVPYAAFCDQDDAWLDQKLARALAHLKSVPVHQPALYCGRTIVCSSDLTPLRASPCFGRSPQFANALVQNIGGGNTMVLNRAALDLVQDTARLADDVISHDWWIYQLVTGAGGTVFYDRKPTVLYRQHDRNLVGANDTFRASLYRIGQLLAGKYRTWNAANINALQRARHWLTPEAQTTLDAFATARRGNLPERLRALWVSRVWRQTRRGTAALWLAALIDRL